MSDKNIVKNGGGGGRGGRSRAGADTGSRTSRRSPSRRRSR